MPPDRARIAVIVAFRNAERHFPALLESLAAQRVSEPWEVVAVDNRSADGSRTVARAFASRLPLRVMEAPARANIGYARNLGARSTPASKLLFVDADDEVGDGYVDAMSRALDAHELVTSTVDAVSLNPEWVRGAHGPPWQVDSLAVFYDFLPAAGSNIGISHSLYDRLGGFPERFPGTEDVALSWLAQLTAATAPRLVPGAVYRYRYRDSLKGLLTQNMYWGAQSVLLYRYFRTVGMPRRRLHEALRHWRGVAGGLLRARSRADFAPLAVQGGLCLGRLLGSLRYGVLYP